MDKVKYTLALLIFIASVSFASAQCDVRQRVMADGSLYNYVAPVMLYQTATRTLQGGVMTDGENYFLELRVTPKLVPMPDKVALTLTLTNDEKYTLDMFDRRSSANDSSLVTTFLMAKDKIEDFSTNEINTVDMMYDKQDSTYNVYTLKLHRALIKEHLECLKSKK